MSRLSDYSKFDHMIDSDDDEDHGNAVESLDNDGGTDATIRASPIVEQGTRTGGSDMNSSITISSNPTESSVVDGGVGTGSMGRMMAMTKKDNESGRYIFEFNGQKIYEWEQGLEEVNVYVKAPPHVKSGSQIQCTITAARLTLGLHGVEKPYINEQTYSKVRVNDSSWCLDDEGIINIVLVKAFRGETWESALLGHGAGEVVDPATKQEIQKDLMIERFQEEHPGFDFRGAEFNGMVPDPQSFMGGVKYS